MLFLHGLVSTEGFYDCFPSLVLLTAFGDLWNEMR
jgi:hypothetical protein